MPRQYIINSWVGAAEYDEGDSYSGEQIGNRNQKSVGVHMLRSGDQWKANIAAYAEQEKPKRTPVKKKSAFERANLADAHYSRLEQLSIELDEELGDGNLSIEDWTCARRQLDKRLDSAWQRVCKAKNWNTEEKDEEIYNLCLPEMQQKKVVDKVGQDGLSFGHSVVESLSETNCLKIPLKKLLTAKEKMVRILHIIKQ